MDNSDSFIYIKSDTETHCTGEVKLVTISNLDNKVYSCMLFSSGSYA